MKKLTNKEFIKRAKEIHGNKYDYNLVNYTGKSNKVKIICPEHGGFEQIAEVHLRGCGCPKCAGRKTNEEFINKCKNMFSQYDYSKTFYKKAREKCIFICNIHGEFLQYADNFLHGHGCPKCGIEKRASQRRSNKEEFIQKAKQIHNNKYNYSEVEYKNANTKVKIFCNHCKKYFYQTPGKHLIGRGCPYCKIEKLNEKTKLTKEEFIERAKEIHDNEYNYSLVNYKNIKTKIKIICKKHGIFEQSPEVHLNGCGCQKCAPASKGEIIIEKILKENNIKFEQQKRFSNCKDKSTLPFDFYLPDKNLLIEYNGRQHYKIVDYFGGYKSFLLQKHHDWLKRKYARDNKINLLIIPYWENIEEKLNEYFSI